MDQEASTADKAPLEQKQGRLQVTSYGWLLFASFIVGGYVGVIMWILPGGLLPFQLLVVTLSTRANSSRMGELYFKPYVCTRDLNVYSKNVCLQDVYEYIKSSDQRYTHVLLLEDEHDIIMGDEISSIEYNVSSLRLDVDNTQDRVRALLTVEALLQCSYELDLLECAGDHITFGRYEGFHLKQTRSGDLEKKHQAALRGLNVRPTAYFYLARSHARLNRTTEAINSYILHLADETLTNYRFQSRYELARLRLDVPDRDHSADFLDAYNEYDAESRWEPLYYLARIARAKQHYNLCIMYTGAALNAPSIDFFKRPLSLEPHIYAWALEEERAYCLHYAGRVHESKVLYRQLLERNLPFETRKRLLQLELK